MSFTIFVLMSSVITAQNTDTFYQNIFYKKYNIQPQKIDSFDSLPDRIKKLSSDFTTNRFGGYNSMIKFIHAQIFPIDTLFKGDITDLKKRNVSVNPIPQYDLYYSFKDSSLGISQYCINIQMDKLGQVLYCNFPNLSSPEMKINSIMNARNYSDSIMTSLNPQISIKNYSISLIYDNNYGRLIWQICYFKVSNEFTSYYQCLLINAHYNKLIMEKEMFDVNFPIELK